MNMTALDHISCFAASIYIFSGFVSEKDYFIWLFSLYWVQTLYSWNIWGLFKNIYIEIYIFCKSKILQKFHVRGIGPFMKRFTKCHVMLQCSNLLLMSCDMSLKVMRIRYCHLESEAHVKLRKDSRELIRRRGWQTNGQTDGWSKERTHDAYPLQHTSPNKSFQGHKDEKAKPKSWSPTFPSPWLTPSSPLISLFFSLFLFLSLSLSSPCVVSLIGRQTACKCSNPEKSPGALVIGCALQHCSQSIKARWAPVNSFSLLLLWLWYCHIDSNFALNPSTTVLSLSRSLSLSLALFTLLLSFSKPQTPSLYCHSKTFLTTLSPGFCYSLFSFFFLEVLALKSLRASSPCTHLVLSS